MIRPFLALAIVSLLSGVRSVIGAGSESGEILLPTSLGLSTLTPVTDPFRRQVSAALQTIPEPVRRLIETAGWRIQLAEFVVDSQPELDRDRPRGWPADTTWLNTDAIHFPVERLLVVAEKRRNARGEIVPTGRVAGVLRHELGHAFDMATGGARRFRSASEAFRSAYQKDVANMTPGSGQILAYYLQESGAGRQEAFAEAFGITLGGGSDVTLEQEFRRCFPAVLVYVRRELEPLSE